MIDFESKRSGNAYYHTIDIHNLNFGMNFSAYVNQIRLDEAVKLLKYTNKTSGEIANECEFSTIRIFNITFKNHFGITPREYRKKYKGSSPNEQGVAQIIIQ